MFSEIFRKTFSTVLTVSMLMSLCSCAGNTGSPESPAAASKASPSAASSNTDSTIQTQETKYPLSDKLINVKGVIVDCDTTNPRTVWQDVEKVTNIHFQWTAVKADSLPVYLAAGDWPDIFQGWGFENSVINDYGVIGNKFVDYNKHLDEMPNLVQAFKDYPVAKKAVTQTNGAIYQLPYIEESATITAARMYYREDVLKSAGQSVPKTLDEFYNVLTALKKYNNGASPFVCGLDETNYCGAFLYSSFGKSTTADFEDDGSGKVIYNRASDQYRNYLKYCHKLYVDGLLHKEYLTLDPNTKLSLARAGKAVFMDATAHSLKQSDFKSGKVELGVLAPLTSDTDKEQKVIGQSPVSTSGGYLMNAKSKYVDLLCKALDIMYATKEVAKGTGLYGESFCYGCEGVNWKYTNADKTQYDFITPKGFDGAFSSYQYDHIIFVNSGRATALKGAVTSTPGCNQARQMGFIKNLIPYQEKNPFPTNFLKFTSDEQSTIDNDYMDIKTYVGEMHDKFISGVKDICNDSVWSEYCKTLKQMNIDDVVKVYQSSYDRWNKT